MSCRNGASRSPCCRLLGAVANCQQQAVYLPAPPMLAGRAALLPGKFCSYSIVDSVSSWPMRTPLSSPTISLPSPAPKSRGRIKPCRKYRCCTLASLHQPASDFLQRSHRLGARGLTTHDLGLDYLQEGSTGACKYVLLSKLPLPAYDSGKQGITSQSTSSSSSSKSCRQPLQLVSTLTHC